MTHGHLYGISIQASDGETTTVTWQIDTHRRETRPYVLRDIASRLHLQGPDQVLEVFDSWSPEQLRTHLSSFTSEQLRPPHFRR